MHVTGRRSIVMFTMCCTTHLEKDVAWCEVCECAAPIMRRRQQEGGCPGGARSRGRRRWRGGGGGAPVRLIFRDHENQ